MIYNRRLEVDKFEVESSDFIVNNTDRLIEACGRVRHLLQSEGLESTTWSYYRYNFWTYAMLADPIFIEVWKDLIRVINNNKPIGAKEAWIQSWLNYDTYETVENNLHHHYHDCFIHGFIAIEPQKTKTVFDEWEIKNAVGNIYIGQGSLPHHVENTAEYSGPRITIGYDLVFGVRTDTHTGRDPQYLPDHPHWIPLVL